MNTLMIQGTTSDAGKSTVVAGLCRLLARRGVSVAPFKPQNMALNSAVTPEGGEIGRSTALQALASGLAPHTDMNPVLLKPETDRGAQVILDGRVHGHMDALDYHAFKRQARETVLSAWERLTSCHDLVIAEAPAARRDQPAPERHRQHGVCRGGGLPGVAGRRHRPRRGLCPTGGYARVAQRQRTGPDRGFVINRFRGDLALLEPGLDWLTGHTGKPVFGVLPHLNGLLLDAEDGLGLTESAAEAPGLRVVVPALPRISNHTDLDALRLHPRVELTLVGPGRAIPPADVILLPGSKSTASDLAWLRRELGGADTSPSALWRPGAGHLRRLPDAR